MIEKGPDYCSFLGWCWFLAQVGVPATYAALVVNGEAAQVEGEGRRGDNNGDKD